VSVVKSHYAALGPRLEYLSDPVVLAQAWKKSHNYIRRHNWYADVLELDCSAVDLDSQLNLWSAQLSNGEYQTSPLRMVPAPKTQAWSFDSRSAGGWGPLQNDLATPILRPLAHLGIREQTVATAVMCCLANCIETAQRNTQLWDQFSSRSRVYSFGNRLHCKFGADGKSERADFSWGNAETYSRYFRDYQWFLKRSSTLAGSLASGTDPSRIILLKLDLKAFYDNISVERLVDRLRLQYLQYREQFANSPESDDGFWRISKAALSFHWDPKDLGLADMLRDQTLPSGLPQGMVASGFFANSYLLPFDQAVATHIDGDAVQIGENAFRVRDYARYVDDLRLVVENVSNNSASAQQAIAKSVSEWVRSFLKTESSQTDLFGDSLDINEQKTQFEAYAESRGEAGIGTRMQVLQQDLSGPFDLATLKQTEIGLEGLLALTESDPGNVKSDTIDPHSLALAGIGRPFRDVTDDTLTRFSALRLTRTLRERFRMADSDTPGGDTTRSALTHQAEGLARRLIGAWAKNPSLGIVLRYALDLVPSTTLLEPVLAALNAKVRQSVSRYERYVALYLLADLYKAAATETGQRSKVRLDGFGNLALYREMLVHYGTGLIGEVDIPWYVLQQVYLFLATRKVAVTNPSLDSALTRHRMLLANVLGSPIVGVLPVVEEAAVACVAYQIGRSVEAFVGWFDSTVRARSRAAVEKQVEVIGQFDPNLLNLLVRQRLEGSRLRNSARAFTQQYDLEEPRRRESPPINRWIPLGQGSRYLPNPFEQENALVKLAVALLGTIRSENIEFGLMTPFSVFVKSSDWSLINDPRSASLEVSFRGYKVKPDPRYQTPSWCQTGLEWMYAIGRLLRSAATGEADFTAKHWLAREDVSVYVGIKSSWYKRRFGMMHTGDAIANSSVPITPWFTELLVRLLQWPGTHIESTYFLHWDSLSSPSELLPLVQDRLKAQGTLYGVSSRLPVYVYPVEFPDNPAGLLRVAVVQSRRPTQLDIGSWFANPRPPALDAALRRHLADLLHLVDKHSLAHNSGDGRKSKPTIDLIVFPELSIRDADQDLVRALSDATGAMVFYGLLDAKDPDTRMPINVGRWLIPVRRNDRRSWIVIDQGKQHLTDEEKILGINQWRPYQVVIELRTATGLGYRMAGAICYDATDLALLSDLRNVSDLFVVPAMNRDVRTFDNLIGAINYHMYQHIIIANSGEFGGSTAQAPYADERARLIAHVHGNNQIAISIFDIDRNHFGPLMQSLQPVRVKLNQKPVKLGKTAPAGFRRNSP
jgi:hypothetical protein